MMIHFDLVYLIAQQIHTCPDLFNLMRTCKLFYYHLNQRCDHSNLDDFLRLWWIKKAFGDGVTEGSTIIHNESKTDFGITKDDNLFQEMNNIIAIIGQNEKMLKYVLNHMSQKFYKGGAIFGNNDFYRPLLQKYSPFKSFLEFNQIESYREIFTKFVKFTYENNYPRSCRTERSYAILLEHDYRKPGYRVIKMNSRCYYIDVILCFDHFDQIDFSTKKQIDTFLLKKSSKNDSIDELTKRFFNVDQIASEMYDKTFNSDYFLLISNTHYDSYECKLIHLPDDDPILQDSFLSDHIFWHHYTNQLNKLNQFYLIILDHFNKKITIGVEDSELIQIAWIDLWKIVNVG